ncbi:MAG: ABC transporter permease [Bacteroidales bacterium]|nr:ABC transporter permease [Bacteroidales bacterium]MBN2757415.1 ABC transporter permease [Bacteroidales bacterium]
MKYSVFNNITLLFSGLIILFIIGPLLSMFISSSGIDLFETAKDKDVQDSIFLTLRVSFITTFIFAFFAIPFSYVMARYNFPLKKIIQGIIDLPIVIPHSAAGIAILGFIARDSTLGKLADIFNLDIVGSPLAIGIAMAFVSVPFLINSARDGFSAVPVRIEKAAYTLGASQIRTFFTISVPLAWKNILSGFIMMFARGMSEFGAVIIVAYHPMITPVLIYEYFGAYGLKYARPVSVIFVTVSLFFFIILRSISNRNRNAEN